MEEYAQLLSMAHAEYMNAHRLAALAQDSEKSQAYLMAARAYEHALHTFNEFRQMDARAALEQDEKPVTRRRRLNTINDEGY